MEREAEQAGKSVCFVWISAEEPVKESAMKITDVKLNGIKNPVGFACGQLSCSWTVCETESRVQENAVIEVSLKEDFSEIFYKKEGKELNQAGETLDFPLSPGTVYYYRITVTGNGGDRGVSDVNFFETGKMGEPWQGEWIAAAEEDSFHPIFRKSFSVSGKLKKHGFMYAGRVCLRHISMEKSLGTNI